MRQFTRSEYRFVGRHYKTRWKRVPRTGIIKSPSIKAQVRLGKRYGWELRGHEYDLLERGVLLLKPKRDRHAVD